MVTDKLPAQADPGGTAITPGGHPSTARVLRAATIALFLALLLWGTLSVDLVFFAGIVFAVFLTRLSRLFSRLLGIPYHLSLAIVGLLLAVVIGGFGYFFARSTISQFQQLSQLLGKAITTLQQEFPGELHLPFRSTNPSQLATTLEGLLGFFSSAATGLGAVIVILFFGFYIAAEPSIYENGIIRLVPQARRQRITHLLATLADVLWFWSLGRLFSMTVIGVFVTAGLWALGLPVPVALGLLAAALALIPYLGAIASAIPALVLALTININHALYVLILYLAIHILEGYILIPMVQRRATHVPPALILAGQLFMGVIAGFLGIILAMPLTVILIPTIEALYVEDVLHDYGVEKDLRKPPAH